MGNTSERIWHDLTFVWSLQRIETTCIMFTHIYYTCSRLFAELLGKVQVTADGVHGHVRLQEGRGMASDISQISQVQTGWIGRSHDSEWFLQIGKLVRMFYWFIEVCSSSPFFFGQFCLLGCKTSHLSGDAFRRSRSHRAFAIFFGN